MNSQLQQLQYAPVTPRDVIQQLKALYEQVVAEQRRQLNQLLNLQRLLNQVQSTTPLTREDQSTKKSKEVKEEKKQFDIEKIGQKIEEIIDDTEEIQIHQNFGDGKKPSTVSVVKTKKQTKSKPEPVVEKKPPIPTVNRSNDPNLRPTNPLKYVPPRNKNQVTGKVTQTKIMTQQKVFRPEVTAKITTVNSTKQSFSTQKRPAVLSQQKQPHSINPAEIDQNSISEYKNLRANQKTNKLKQFSKPIEQLCEQIKRKKQSVKKRFNFKQVIEKYQNEEMGHKAIEDKRRMQFVKKLNNFGLSINRSNCNQITASMPKRLWKQYPHIFQFNNLIESLEQGINAIESQCQNDLRIDLKSAYRLQVKSILIEKQLQKIRISTQIQVPEKIQLTFKPLLPADKNKLSISYQEKQSDLEVFYTKMIGLLKQVQQNESLTAKQLSLVRVMAEIGLYDGKKSPIIVKTDEFQQWKDFYADVKDAQGFDKVEQQTQN